MKLSHTELEEAKADPIKWVRKKKTGGGVRIGGYNTIVKNNIYKYHNAARENAEEVRSNILQQLTKRNFRDASKTQLAMGKFNAYVDWYLASGTVVFDTRHRLNYTVVEDIVFSGLICRLDIVPEGYRAILLNDVSATWQQELRMPLIQRAVALATKRPESETVVGVQNLNGSNLQTTSYSSSDIDRAETTFVNLSLVVCSEMEIYEDEDNDE
jgi:hypothetical protein